MAKGKKGFTNDELDYLSNISDAELDRLLSEKLGHRGTAQGQQTNMPQQTMPQAAEISAPDISSIKPEELDSQINAMFDRYVDPATLESRPEWANGSAPDRAIPKTVDGATWNRVKMSFGKQTNEQKVQYLEKDYGKGNVVYNQNRDQFSIKNEGTWYQLDPEGGGTGDWFDKATERTRDILADNANIAVGVGAGALTAMTGGLSAPVTGPLATAALTAGTAAQVGAVSAMTTTLLGRLANTYEATPWEMARDIGMETLLNVAGAGILPAAKLTTKLLGNQISKAAPALSKLAPEFKEGAASIFGFASGTNSSSYRYIMDAPKEFADKMSVYGKNLVKAEADNIADVEKLARNTRNALYKWYGNGMNEVIELAGERFKPKISQTLKENFQGLANAGLGSVDDSGRFVLNSFEKMGKINSEVVSELEDAGAYKLMKNYVDDLNKWVGKADAVGESGSKQFFAFKKNLNSVEKRIGKEAADAGLYDITESIKKMNRGIKEKIFNSAIDDPTLLGANASTNNVLRERLAKARDAYTALEKGYGDKKKVLRPILTAVERSEAIGNQAYDKLYRDTFVNANITPSTVRAGDAFDEALKSLGKVDNSLGELRQQIGLRRAVIDTSPWIRKGLVGQVPVLGAITMMNPKVLLGAALTSPTVNRNAAKFTGSLLNGLSWLQKQSPDVKMSLGQNGKAAAQFFNTLTSIPGLESQMGSQLIKQVTDYGQQPGQ